mmetsp:Transcript_30096/g.33620  ORF Transcript_30096/g.33620 Transcript_30096/m.33620 type:complete len:421 (+) Transcript_30096:52-1314(+)
MGNKNGVGSKSRKKKKHVEYTTPDGVKYIGECLGYKRHGKGECIWPDGKKYSGEYQDDKMNGMGTLTCANGTSYFGTFMDDKRHGVGAWTFADGAQWLGEWVSDTPIGEGKLTIPDTPECMATWFQSKHKLVTHADEYRIVKNKLQRIGTISAESPEDWTVDQVIYAMHMIDPELSYIMEDHNITGADLLELDKARMVNILNIPRRSTKKISAYILELKRVDSKYRATASFLCHVPADSREYRKLYSKVISHTNNQIDIYNPPVQPRPITFLLVSARRVSNPKLAASFEAMKQKLKDQTKESVGFHGTHPSNLEGIYRQGLLPYGHRSNPSTSTEAGRFGNNTKGIYVSRYVDYCLKYCCTRGRKTPLKVGDTAKVVMFKVLTGRTHIVKKVREYKAYNRTHSSTKIRFSKTKKVLCFFS